MMFLGEVETAVSLGIQPRSGRVQAEVTPCWAYGSLPNNNYKSL